MTGLLLTHSLGMCHALSMTAKIFTWVGHPAEQSLSHGLMDAYESGATSAGAQIRRMNISEMDFNPNLEKWKRRLFKAGVKAGNR